VVDDTIWTRGTYALFLQLAELFRGDRSSVAERSRQSDIFVKFDEGFSSLLPLLLLLLYLLSEILL